MKTLLLDIETAPNTAHVWGLWDQNISLNQLLESSYILCWAAKWSDQSDVTWERAYGKNGKNRRKMLVSIHSMLNQADVVIHYNGTKFDLPTLNKEFLLHDLPQPSPYKEIDLLKVVRSKFRFTSNKLDYVTSLLGLGSKLKHDGHEMWIGCMNDDPQAWAQMGVYNRNDVSILEELYTRLRPWVKGYPNHSLYHGDADGCPTCGTTRYQKRGFYYTLQGRYQRYQCLDCGVWFRGVKALNGKTGFRGV